MVDSTSWLLSGPSKDYALQAETHAECVGWLAAIEAHASRATADAVGDE